MRAAILALALFGMPAAQQPSLSETLEFIVGHVNENGGSLQINGRFFPYSYTASIRDGVMDLTEVQRTQTNHWTVALADLIPSVGLGPDLGGSRMIRLSCYLGRECAAAVIDGEPTREGSVQILLVSPEAERVANAFRHAIELSGGHREPF